MAPLFSIIVPTYNRASHLHEALTSVAAQELTDFECIVVDDASPEPVRLPFRDDRFRVVRHEENRGPAGARNTGVDQAAGALIAFLDDGDCFTPRRLTIAAADLERAPVAVCGSGGVGGSKSSGRFIEGDVHDTILDSTTPNLGATAVMRERCIRFDETFDACEDLDWWIRVTASSPIASTREIGWLWRRHDGVRERHGARARVAGSERLLQLHREYFDEHPRAAAFRWFRIGQLAAELGDRSLARQAARRSLSLDRSLHNALRNARIAVAGSR
jgi:hypothetical protein